MSASGPPIYTLRFRNRSGRNHDFACFQSQPDPDLPHPPLAWFAQTILDGVDVDFDWTLTYDFVWMESGVLAPGIAFRAEEILPADLTTANRIPFGYSDGAFGFGTPTGTGAAGSLTIDIDTSVPGDRALVGIGMAGSPTFVVLAQPNMEMVFTPHPQYWITYGQFKHGQALDHIPQPKPVQVVFPPNIFEMIATLNVSGHWNLDPGFG